MRCARKSLTDCIHAGSMPPLDYFKMLIYNDFYELEIVNNFAFWCELHTIGALVKGMRLFGVWSRGQFQASLKRRNVLIHELGGGLGLVHGEQIHQALVLLVLAQCVAWGFVQRHDQRAPGQQLRE